MPMWSPVTRSIPAALSAAPRNRLPPPITRADLDADADQLPDFQGHAVQHLRIDPEVFRAHQGLAAKLEQNALVARLTTTASAEPLRVSPAAFEFCANLVFAFSGRFDNRPSHWCQSPTTPQRSCPLNLTKRPRALAGSLFGATAINCLTACWQPAGQQLLQRSCRPASRCLHLLGSG